MAINKIQKAQATTNISLDTYEKVKKICKSYNISISGFLSEIITETIKQFEELNEEENYKIMKKIKNDIKCHDIRRTIKEEKYGTSN